MRLYATPDAYTAAGYGAPPANIDLLIRHASRAVDRLLLGRVYDTDTDGMPTDADVAQTLADAACAIAAELDATGVLTAGGTVAYDAVGIGNVSLSGRKAGADTAVVDGVPVPAAALSALASVGRVYITSVPRYVRPLDRIAR